LSKYQNQLSKYQTPSFKDYSPEAEPKTSPPQKASPKAQPMVSTSKIPSDRNIALKKFCKKNQISIGVSERPYNLDQAVLCDSLQYCAVTHRVIKNSEEKPQKVPKIPINTKPPKPPKGQDLKDAYTSELGKKMRERMHHMRDNFSYKDFISKFLKRD
jgi:hypothetical protein